MPSRHRLIMRNSARAWYFSVALLLVRGLLCRFLLQGSTFAVQKPFFKNLEIRSIQNLRRFARSSEGIPPSVSFIPIYYEICIVDEARKQVSKRSVKISRSTQLAATVRAMVLWRLLTKIRKKMRLTRMTMWSFPGNSLSRASYGQVDSATSG